MGEEKRAPGTQCLIFAEVTAGKLKDLGNSILGRFGMSVDNFKAVKDPNTGSYSINFQR
ncbi:hypothetical protein AMTR_s00032p00162310 [Amborella trichopoda]|uniref:Uncharacterized protein n=1 Tax=Amborella trichopoda TaxID=13333 RepID=U5D0G8_AMBTC|nr:hypothetical protein AMTR_s00032p00162310 [Amborella trichopoda]